MRLYWSHLQLWKLSPGAFCTQLGSMDVKSSHYLHQRGILLDVCFFHACCPLPEQEKCWEDTTGFVLEKIRLNRPTSVFVFIYVSHVNVCACVCMYIERRCIMSCIVPVGSSSMLRGSSAER